MYTINLVNYWYALFDQARLVNPVKQGHLDSQVNLERLEDQDHKVPREPMDSKADKVQLDRLDPRVVQGSLGNLVPQDSRVHLELKEEPEQLARLDPQVKITVLSSI